MSKKKKPAKQINDEEHDLYKDYEPDGRDLAEWLESSEKTDPNYVRPRRNELVKMGKVRMVNKRQCTISGKMSMVFRVVI